MREGQAGRSEESSPEQASLLDVHIEHKSLFIAYLLLLIGGIFGLHHMYLGDMRLAKMYFFSLGLCGLGVVMDFLRMPTLVRQANAANTGNQSDSAGSPDTSPARRQYSPPSDNNSSSSSEGHQMQTASAVGASRRDEREAQIAARDAEKVAHLQAMFSNLPSEVVQKTWTDSKRNITTCVEVLSGLSESMRRQVTVIKSPIPLSYGGEANVDEFGKKECMVCFENNVDAVLLPCQHSGFCVKCATAIFRRNPPLCPVCRYYISDVIRFAGSEEGEEKGEVREPAALTETSNTAEDVGTAAAADSDRPHGTPMTRDPATLDEVPSKPAAGLGREAAKGEGRDAAKGEGRDAAKGEGRDAAKKSGGAEGKQDAKEKGQQPKDSENSLELSSKETPKAEKPAEATKGAAKSKDAAKKSCDQQEEKQPATDQKDTAALLGKVQKETVEEAAEDEGSGGAKGHGKAP